MIRLEDGLRLYYEKVGDGPQTVLIPNGFHMLDEFKPLADSRTLIFYDVRNRGRSDCSTVTGGIQNDVTDLDAVRRHFGLDRINVIGHSYMGSMVALYAMAYPDHVGRVIQIGPTPPDIGKQYPEDLTNKDSVLAEVFAKLGQLSKEADPVESCKKFWSVLREIYVANPADAEKINWGRCELPNERNFMKYWTEQIMPSLQKLDLSAESFAKVKAPVLIIHGKKDRSAPYGGGQDWALMFPNARLLTVENAAHAPWIEAPGMVFGAITAFLNQAAFAS